MAESLRGLLYIFGVRYCTNLQVIPATATPKMNFYHPVLTTFLFVLTTILLVQSTISLASTTCLVLEKVDTTASTNEQEIKRK